MSPRFTADGRRLYKGTLVYIELGGTRYIRAYYMGYQDEGWKVRSDTSMVSVVHGGAMSPIANRNLWYHLHNVAQSISSKYEVDISSMQDWTPIPTRAPLIL